MSTGLKILAALIIAALYSGGCLYLGYRYEKSNTVAAQAALKIAQDNAKVDAAKALAQDAKDKAALQSKLDTAEHNYETLLAQQGPSIASATSTAYSAGSLILRDNTPQSCPSSNAGSNATASARAADAAATQALADRVQNSIAAVRIGDASDKREHDLDAQIYGLQAVVIADRQVGAAVSGNTTDGKQH